LIFFTTNHGKEEYYQQKGQHQRVMTSLRLLGMSLGTVATDTADLMAG
jgi:hypothetical protein